MRNSIKELVKKLNLIKFLILVTFLSSLKQKLTILTQSKILGWS